jgi:purine-binding chemotaxis protein CheW
MANPTLATAPDLDATVTAAGHDQEMIVFRVQAQEYAVPIHVVQEIILLQRPTRIPNAPCYVEGIINLRGKIVPVIDAAKRLGLANNSVLDQYQLTAVGEEAEKNARALEICDDRIIVFQIGTDTFGMVVDAVSEVLTIKHTAISQPPQELSQRERFVTGIGNHDNRLLIMLDPSRMIGGLDGKDFGQAEAA